MIIRRRKSKKQQAVEAVGNAAKTVAKIRLSWAAAKTAGKFAAPLAAIGAVAAIAKKRSGGGPETVAA